MAEIVTLKEAVSELVSDGAMVAMEGFSHLIPHAAGHEVIRQRKHHLSLVRLTPDIVFDQLIGMGVADRLIFSWGGNPGVGSLHRFRDAIENSWPRPLAIEEHSHAGLTNRFVAGASGLPFAVLRAYAGTDLETRSKNVKPVECPFTGEILAAVPAINPDVAIVHAQQADAQGNVQMWGITGVQKEAVLASTRSIVTVEEIVAEIELRPGGVVIPAWAVTAVALAPRGAHPSYVAGYYDRDNAFYGRWDAISRERETFLSWMEANVLDRAAQ